MEGAPLFTTTLPAREVLDALIWGGLVNRLIADIWDTEGELESLPEDEQTKRLLDASPPPNMRALALKFVTDRTTEKLARAAYGEGGTDEAARAFDNHRTRFLDSVAETAAAAMQENIPPMVSAPKATIANAKVSSRARLSYCDDLSPGEIVQFTTPVQVNLGSEGTALLFGGCVVQNHRASKWVLLDPFPAGLLEGRGLTTVRFKLQGDRIKAETVETDRLRVPWSLLEPLDCTGAIETGPRSKHPITLWARSLETGDVLTFRYVDPETGFWHIGVAEIKSNHVAKRHLVATPFPRAYGSAAFTIQYSQVLPWSLPKDATDGVYMGDWEQISAEYITAFKHQGLTRERRQLASCTLTETLTAPAKERRRARSTRSNLN